MTTGDPEKKICITAQKYWPVVCWRTDRSESLWFSSLNLRISWSCRPKIFDNVIPDTERVSWVIADISALDSWASAVTRRRRCPM